MLQEFPKVRQDQGTYRRLFTDEYFDLYLWYRRRWGRFLGFQLVYDKGEDPHSLTWTEETGYLHNRIDEGEDSCLANMTPILVPDGLFDHETVGERFQRSSVGLEETILSLVTGHIRQSGIVGFDCASQAVP